MSTSRSTIIAVVPTETTTNEKNPNTLKFGITTPLKPENKGELYLLGQEQPLSDAVEAMCEKWGFPDPTIFALKFSDGRYVTESTRKELSGKLISMSYSPGKVSTEIIEKLKNQHLSNIDEGLEELAKQAGDPTFADSFVSLEGLQVLVGLIEKDRVLDKSGMLCNALQALLDIMLQAKNVTWEQVNSPVISRIAGVLNNQKGSQDKATLAYALQVLESCVSSGQAHAQVEKEVPLPTLVFLIKNPDVKVQENALSLVNALLSRADLNKRKHLASTLAHHKYRDIIRQCVINKPERPLETNFQLYVMQTLFVNFLGERKSTPIDAQDQEALGKINELCRIAFDSDGAFSSASSYDVSSTGKKEKRNFSRDYKKLGFTDSINPARDFEQVPPGALALDCMYHLAKVHTEKYGRIVLESACRSSGDECPFARASIELVTVLCDILKVGEPPKDQQGKFYPFFFEHEKPFEELFCICAELVIKTWKEMRATTEDFAKVFDVVGEQIRRSLDQTPAPASLDALQSHLNNFTYAEITNLRQQERDRREDKDFQSYPIQMLKKSLEPEMMELVKCKRMNLLKTGTRFTKYYSKGLRAKEKFLFCRLSCNKKVLHYGDCEEKTTPPDELSSKVSVVDLKELLTGKDCPHVKEAKGKKINAPLAFSLVIEKEPLQTIDFVAPDEDIFDQWTDGINCLLGKPMTSKKTQFEMNTLLFMEIKLKLMNLEGIAEIPQTAPPIPPRPDKSEYVHLLAASNAKLKQYAN